MFRATEKSPSRPCAAGLEGSMLTDDRLLTHPVIRAEAERLAREGFGALCDHDPAYSSRAMVTLYTLSIIHARLLADTSRPETRDWLVRSGTDKERQYLCGCASCDAAALNRWRGYRNDPAALVEHWLAVHRGC